MAQTSSSAATILPIRPIPFIRIINQPSPVYRMRYKAENRNTILFSEEFASISKNSLKNSTKNDNIIKFPRIEIVNGQGPATLIVTCVNKCEPYHVHPHKLVGEKCKSGVGVFNIGVGERIFNLTGLSIEFTRQKDFTETFNELKQKNVDPFNVGFNFDHSKIDLTQLRLCFQVYLRDSLETNEIVRDGYHILRPIVSNIISNSSRKSSLQIIRANNLYSQASGGNLISLHLKKLETDQRPLVAKFFDDNGWNAQVLIPETEIHYRCAVMFQAPFYKNRNITDPVTVSFQLYVPFKNENDKKEFLETQKSENSSESDEEESTPTVDNNDLNDCKYATKIFDFLYTPCDINSGKRKLDTVLFYDFQDQSERDAVNELSQESRKKLAKRQVKLISSNYNTPTHTINLISNNPSDPILLNHSIKYAQSLGLFNDDIDSTDLNEPNDLNLLKEKLDNYVNETKNPKNIEIIDNNDTNNLTSMESSSGLDLNNNNLDFINQDSFEILCNSKEDINYDDIFG